MGTGEEIYWNASSFGADQEVYVTLTNVGVNTTEQALLLKSQSSSGYGSGVIEVQYDAPNSRVQVWTFTSQQDWVQRGADIAATFSDGDQFGARAKANGTVEVYRNYILLATRDVTDWPDYANGGYIGLWFSNGCDAMLDDLGGETAQMPLTAAFSASPVTGNVPLTVTFTNQSTPTSTITGYLWAFGDGYTATITNPVHSYTSAGYYTVTLTAMAGAAQNTLTRTNYITVSAADAPSAAFTASPVTGTVPLTVTFTNQSTPTSTITGYLWTFGDGYTATITNPVHSYTSAGYYTVTLEALAGAEQNTITKTNYITVSATSAPTAAFTASPVTGTVPLTVTFANQSSPTQTITSYLWKFGDDSTSAIANPEHTYTATGYYTVALTAYTGAAQDTITKTNYITATSGGSAATLLTTTIGYTYDPLQRLISATASGATTYTFAYAYDAVGNRTAQTQTITSTLVTNYTYDAGISKQNFLPATNHAFGPANWGLMTCVRKSTPEHAGGTRRIIPRIWRKNGMAFCYDIPRGKPLDKCQWSGVHLGCERQPHERWQQGVHLHASEPAHHGDGEWPELECNVQRRRRTDADCGQQRANRLYARPGRAIAGSVAGQDRRHDHAIPVRHGHPSPGRV